MFPLKFLLLWVDFQPEGLFFRHVANFLGMPYIFSMTPQSDSVTQKFELHTSKLVKTIFSPELTVERS